jgi:hypothetical protein
MGSTTRGGSILNIAKVARELDKASAHIDKLKNVVEGLKSEVGPTPVARAAAKKKAK